MKKYLTRLLLCVLVLSTGLPAQSQTPDHPTLGEAQQISLDEKLMQTLWFVPRGHCDLTAVLSLLQQGASPNARNEDGNTLTALMVAAQNGCSDIVKLLLDAGAKVNVKAAFVSGVQANVLDGITALWSAASSENAEVVRMLLEHGADLNALTSYDATVMLRASTNEIVQIFLDRGLDINAKDKGGYTLLIRSAESGGRHRPSIAFLLQHGADPNAKADDGTTALKLAKGIKHPDDVELLEKAGAKE
jgi:ankyrin repeat protein